jgi:hypothetical protein
LALHFLPAIALCASFSASALAADSGIAQDLVIADLKGDVRLVVRGEPRAAQKGNTVDLPATIRTGRVSSIELHQGQTTVAAGADTQLEIPAIAVRGDLLERVVQSSGNTFYSVAKRGAKKFRVETPYLVAVVKGTQFNVSVQDDASTVSLFEGQLEIRSADGSDVVNIEAGEIAVRRASDARIRVLRMDTGEPVARADAATSAVARNSDGPVAPASNVALPSDVTAPRVVALPGQPSLVDAIDVTNAGRIVAEVSIADTAIPDIAVADVAIADDRLSIQATTEAAAISTQIDLDGGTGTVDVGVAAGVDLGPVIADVGTDVGADLGAGTVTASVDAGVDLGGAVSAGLTSDTSVDLGAGTLDIGTTLTAGDTTVSADVNVGTGSIGAEVTAGPIDLGLGVDLGNDGGITLDVGGSTSTGGSTTVGAAVGSTVGNAVNGLLGAIGGRRGRP